MNIKDMQAKLPTANSLENLKALLEGYEYKDYCDLEIPKFGGSDKIPDDDDSFRPEQGTSDGIYPDSLTPVSWDEDRVLAYTGYDLEIIGREDYANMHGGVICPFCKAMVNCLCDCPNLVCYKEYANCEVYWLDSRIKELYNQAIRDNLHLIDDEEDRELVIDLLNGDSDLNDSDIPNAEELIEAAWHSISPKITSIYVYHHASGGFGSWALEFWFAPDELVN